MEEKENKGILKEFKLSSLSLKNKMTVYVITAITLLAGLSTYMSMPREAFPEIVMPQIYVGTPYPGNSSADIEKLITRPLEKEIKSISGIDKMTSTSVQGYSTIFIEFDFSITPEEALRKVKDKVDLAKGDPDFPNDLPADPNVFEMNMSEMMPIVNINLSGDYSVDQLKEYAEYLEDKIEALPEITEVDIRGVTEKEMKINVDLAKMEAMEISFNDIANAVRNENITISGGDVLSGNTRRTVRVVGDFMDASELEDVTVKQEDFNIVYLRDIAEVVFEEAEKTSYAREYQKPVVMVDVKKRGGENLIQASESINKIIDEAKGSVIPDNVTITLTNDQSDDTRRMVSELENSIIFGMLLVVLVLLFFLGIRNALFVGIAIPLSMLLSLFILGSMGITLNIMVLFSLILALGMLVDNGIVVVENIYRLMDEEGMPAMKAARYGVGEVAMPIIASTATTLAAFLPLAIWPGMMGEFMFWLPVTLMTVLGSSLFVALVINPVLTSVLMKVEEKKSNPRKLAIVGISMILFGILMRLGGALTFGSLLIIGGVIGFLNYYILSPGTKWFQNKFLPLLENIYNGFIGIALKRKNPIWFFIGTIVFFIVSIVLLAVATPKVIFFPIGQPKYVNIFIEAPIGTDIEETNVITKELESRILEYGKRYEDTTGAPVKGTGRNFLIKSVIAQVGEGTSDPSQGPSMANTPHKGRITVSFVEFQFRRGIQTSDVMEDMRKIVKGIPGVQVTVDKNNDGPPVGKPITIEITGDDYDNLIAQAESVKSFIDERNIGGIEELKLDVEVGKPEYIIEVDRKKARRFNVSTYQIGSTLRTALFGQEVSTFKDGEDDYDIVIRLKDDYRYDADLLMDQKITFRDQTNGQIRQIPISSIATARKTSTYSSVKRKDMNRMITIASNVLDGYNANEVVAEIKKVVAEYDLPEENTLAFAGEQEEQQKESAFLMSALLIAVFLIFLIIVSQFNSLSTPVIIVGSVVFSLIGVFLGLVIFQMDFVIIMTMIGIISLAGIVVNNAIVLIDYTNLVIARRIKELGIDVEKGEKLSVPEVIKCVAEGGKTRLRPVLLTAITTVLGLLPLATGMNIDFFGFLKTGNPDIYLGGENVMFWGPMSWTIIFGLIFATFLTLIIVPVMYYLLIRFKYAIGVRARG
ncbi:MAG: copper transporter [Crocinitomicaceae bacterium]|nr:copper transporter [Crocinitomicaceae bacterium]|tara:strand:+ start:10779 stop:14240 length:3462 start_codon:yes stop_codon:yes gene_type:complete